MLLIDWYMHHLSFCPSGIKNRRVFCCCPELSLGREIQMPHWTGRALALRFWSLSLSSLFEVGVVCGIHPHLQAVGARPPNHDPTHQSSYTIRVQMRCIPDLFGLFPRSRSSDFFRNRQRIQIRTLVQKDMKTKGTSLCERGTSVAAGSDVTCLV